MLQVDPSQKKAVVVLLVALVGAVAFLLMRIMPGACARQVAAPTNQSALPSAQSRAAAEVHIDPARNPFRRPGGAGATLHAVDAPAADEFAVLDRTAPLPDAVAVRPMPVPAFQAVQRPAPARIRDEKPQDLPGVAMARPHAPAAPAAGQGEVPAEPTFKLLATISSGGVYSAVLRVGDTQARVVEVGDVIDGRYKVARLQENLAVLLDGRNVIIATRPRS